MLIRSLSWESRASSRPHWYVSPMIRCNFLNKIGAKNFQKWNLIKQRLYRVTTRAESTLSTSLFIYRWCQSFTHDCTGICLKVTKYKSDFTRRRSLPEDTKIFSFFAYDFKTAWKGSGNNCQNIGGVQFFGTIFLFINFF